MTTPPPLPDAHLRMASHVLALLQAFHHDTAGFPQKGKTAHQKLALAACVRTTNTALSKVAKDLQRLMPHPWSSHPWVFVLTPSGQAITLACKGLGVHNPSKLDHALVLGTLGAILGAATLAKHPDPVVADSPKGQPTPTQPSFFFVTQQHHNARIVEGCSFHEGFARGLMPQSHSLFVRKGEDPLSCFSRMHREKATPPARDVSFLAQAWHRVTHHAWVRASAAADTPHPVLARLIAHEHPDHLVLLDGMHHASNDHTTWQRERFAQTRHTAISALTQALITMADLLDRSVPRSGPMETWLVLNAAHTSMRTREAWDARSALILDALSDLDKGTVPDLFDRSCVRLANLTHASTLDGVDTGC